MKLYTANKLVRDNIPKIIESKGNTCDCVILEKENYIKALKLKLIEEANEVKEAETKESTMEEIADVLEVLYAYMKEENIKMEEIEKIRLAKKEKNGGFENKLYMTTYTK